MRCTVPALLCAGLLQDMWGSSWWHLWVSFASICATRVYAPDLGLYRHTESACACNTQKAGSRCVFKLTGVRSDMDVYYELTVCMCDFGVAACTGVVRTASAVPSVPAR
jgi:hypothetical protein